MSLITPRTLKGFRDYVPSSMMPRERLIETAKRVYRSYGFSPIDTPALEYLEVLQGKGSDETDRQLYQFVDHGGRAVGLRFDLTVPLARFVAQHASELGMPFKRYHVATVWRGENTQRGRYREFMQCDFDTIGTQSVVADIETALVIHDLMLAIGFDQFTICVNNRLVLNGLLEKLGLAAQATAILRALDKLAKIGAENVLEEMQQQAQATRAQAQQVLQLAALRGTADEVLQQLDTALPGASLTAANKVYDGVVTGISDLGFSCIAYTPGIFPVMELLDMPNGYPLGYAATKAVNDFYNNFKPEEFDKVHVLAFYATGPQVVFTTKKPVKSLEDVKGLVLRSTGVGANIAKALGADIGTSRCEEDKLSYASEMVFKALCKGVRFMLPCDSLAADHFAADAEPKLVDT